LQQTRQALYNTIYVRGYLQGSENGRVVMIAFTTSAKKNDSTLGFKWIQKITQNILWSYIHNTQ